MRYVEPVPRAYAFACIVAVATLAGGVLGGLTNAVNGAVSPGYFVRVMRWADVQDVHRAAIAQGIFEGLLYAAVFSAIFVLVVGIASRTRATLRFMLGVIGGVGIGVLVCWCVGGTIAMGLATLSPDFYRHRFRGVPTEHYDLLRDAWVGGSIWGGMFGAVMSGVIAPVYAAFSCHKAIKAGPAL